MEIILFAIIYFFHLIKISNVSELSEISELTWSNDYFSWELENIPVAK